MGCVEMQNLHFQNLKPCAGPRLPVSHLTQGQAHWTTSTNPLQSFVAERSVTTVGEHGCADAGLAAVAEAHPALRIPGRA